MHIGEMRIGEMQLGEMQLGEMQFGEMQLGEMQFGEMQFGAMQFGAMLGQQPIAGGQEGLRKKKTRRFTGFISRKRGSGFHFPKTSFISRKRVSFLESGFDFPILPRGIDRK